MKFTLLTFFLLCYANIIKANDFVVIINQPKTLNYYIEGKKHFIKKDVKNLETQFISSPNSSLFRVYVTKITTSEMQGKILFLENGKSQKATFKNWKQFQSLCKKYVKQNANFLYLGHTPNVNNLGKLFKNLNSHFNSITLSACKAIKLDLLKLCSKYSDFLLGSPENLHLAHVELNNIHNTFASDTIVTNLKTFQKKSYDRLKKISKSNLILTLIDLKYFRKGVKDFQNLSQIKKSIIKREIQLSSFEKRDEENIEFYILSALKP